MNPLKLHFYECESSLIPSKNDMVMPRNKRQVAIRSFQIGKWIQFDTVELDKKYKISLEDERI